MLTGWKWWCVQEEGDPRARNREPLLAAQKQADAELGELIGAPEIDPSTKFTTAKFGWIEGVFVSYMFFFEYFFYDQFLWLVIYKPYGPEFYFKKF